MENEELSAFEIAGLIVQQLHGKISKSDRLKLDRWRTRDARNQLLYKELSDNTNREVGLHQLANFDTGKAFDRLTRRIELPIEMTDNHRVRRLLLRWSVAASVLIMLAILFLFRGFESPKLLTARAPMGKMIQLTLPDNSKVWLNAGTTLQYPDRFTGQRRLINLTEGEAFFDVVHDPDKPFVIQTANGNISVLGTSFDVNAYKNDSEEKVTVQTGKVGLQIPGSSVSEFVLPGERLTIKKAGNAILKSKIRIEDIAAWREQRLIFDDQPLSDVIHSLERKYNVIFRIENRQVLTQRLTMHLNNQPLTDVLTAISFSSHLKFKEINEKLIVIQ